MRVLVVDDSRAMRMIIRRELRKGADIDDVVEADSGRAALAVVRTDSVDLVLSDWNMPGMTGIELLESLRAQGWHGLFGFITSESGQSTRTRAFEAGATFVVTKPFTGDSLTRQINQAFGWTPSNSVDDRGPAEDGGPTVASVLGGLLRRSVTVAQADPPRREVARAVARYVDAEGRDVAVAIAEIDFAAFSGAALSMAQAVTAAEWAKAGVLTEAIAQNFYEVANVLATVVNPGGARCTLAEVILLADFEKPPNHERLAASSTQLNLEAAIDGYGSGRIALIALDPARAPVEASSAP
jgi:two-component system, chemotaxis family, chemotaxis protein CheY